MGPIPLTKESTMQERWAWLLSHLTINDRKMLFSLAYSITNNPDDAADVLQEALLQGAMHCYQLKNEDRLYQWMYSIVKRAAYRCRGKSTCHLLIKLREVCKESIYHTTLEESILHADEQERLWMAIEHLKSPGKEIMKLKYSGEWNLRVIAERLGLNYHTTRSVYQRARREIIKELEAYYNEKD